MLVGYGVGWGLGVDDCGRVVCRKLIWVGGLIWVGVSSWVGVSTNIGVSIGRMIGGGNGGVLFAVS